MSKAQLSALTDGYHIKDANHDRIFCEQDNAAIRKDQSPQNKKHFFHKMHPLGSLRWSVIIIIVMMGLGGYSDVKAQCTLGTTVPANRHRIECVGENVTFRQNYTITVEPTVTWQYNDDNIGDIDGPDNIVGWRPISGSGALSAISTITGNFASAFSQLSLANPGATYEEYEFRVVFDGGSCSNVTSGEFRYDLNGPFSIGTQPTSATICETATSQAFSVGATNSGSGTLTYLWRFGPSMSGPWTNMSNANASGSGFNTANLVLNNTHSSIWPDAGDTVFVQCRVALTGCTNIFSTAVQLSRDVAPTITSGSADVTICASGSAILSAGLGGSASGITWSVSPNSGTFSTSNTANPVTYSNSAPGAYTITATTNSNACPAATDVVVVTVSSQLPTTVDAGPDQTVCAGNNVTLDGTIGGPVPFTTGTWSALSGSFLDPADVDGIYTPSISSGTVELVLSSVDPPGICPVVRDTMVVTVNAAVTVNVGADASVCLGDSILVTADMMGSVSTGTWSGGTGTFRDASMNSTRFIPSATGTMNLTFTSTSGVCESVSDALALTVNGIIEGTLPTAGDLTKTICAGSSTTFRKNRMTFPASPAGSVNTWLYDDGTGLKPVDLAGATYTNNATYTQININNAPVDWNTYTFAVEVTNGTCKDTFGGYTLYVNTPAIAIAGVDTSMCAGATFTLSSANYGGSATSGTWFRAAPWLSDGSIALNVYTPGPDALDSGYVKLYVQTNDPTGPCPLKRDTMILNIDSLAIIGNNGLTKNVCEAGNTNFRATYRSNGMETVAWQYRVSPTDPWLSAASLGTVDAPASPATGKNTRLSLTNVPLTYDPYEFRAYITLGNCKDSLAFILNVNEGGTVNAGLDQTICVVGNSADLTGTLTGGYEGIATTWSAAIGSDGTFSSTSMLATTFTPGTTDISNGSVDLYLVTNSLPGCGVKRDTVTIAIVANDGMLYAGPDANVCAGSPFNVAGNIFAPFSPVTSATWTSTGTGLFFDPLSPGSTTYTPSAADIAAEEVKLILTSNNMVSTCPSIQDTMVLTIEKIDISGYLPSKIINTCDGEEITLSVTIETVTSPMYAWYRRLGAGAPDDLSTNALSYDINNATAADSGYVYYMTVTAAGCMSTSDSFKLNVNGPITFPTQPTDAGTVCNSASVTFTAAASANVVPALQWESGTSMTGPFTDVSGATSGTLNLSSGSSIWPVLGGTVYLRMRASIADCDPVYSDTVSLNVDITGPAMVNAGSDQMINCDLATKEVTLAGAISGAASSAIWSVSSASTPGGTFQDVNFLGSKFTLTPAQMLSGSVNIVLSSNDPSGVCPVVKDTMNIKINNVGTINAGADMTVCTGAAPVTLMGTSMSPPPSPSYTWSVVAPTTGSISNPTDLNGPPNFPQYIPSMDDRTAGIGTIELRRNATATCPVKRDTVVFTISNTSSVMAGGDQTVCFGSPITLGGSFTTMPATSITWSIASSIPSELTGSFLDVHNPTTQFTPNAGGVYTLQITSNPGLPGACPVVSDQVTIVVEKIDITSHTPSSLLPYVCASSSVNMSVAFTGTTGINTTYTRTWQYKGKSSTGATHAGFASVTGTNHPGVSGNTTTGLNFAPTYHQNGNEYRLRITKNGCEAISDTFVLSVPATITGFNSTTPDLLDQCSNLPTALFNTTFTENDPFGNSDVEFRWQSNTANVLTGWIDVPTSVSGYNNDTIILSNGGPLWPNVGSSIYLRLTFKTSVGGGTKCSYTSSVIRRLQITNQAPVGNAGLDRETCGATPVVLAGSFSGGATSASWASDPACPSCFVDPNFVGTTYTPSAANIAAGTVDLILTTNDPLASCGVDKDTMTIIIGNGSVTATNPAGPSFVRTVCDGANATFSVDYTSSPATVDPSLVLWEYYNGSGWAPIVGSSVSHDFPAYAAGSRLRVLAVDRDSQNGWDFRCSVTYPGCTAIVHTFDLVINEGPTIESYTAPTAVCASDSISLSAVIGGTGVQGTWEVFTGDAANLDTLDLALATASYHPDAADIARGYVTFKVKTNNPGGPCPSVQSGIINVYIHDITGVAITPGNQTQCVGENQTFTAAWVEDDITLDSTVVWQYSTDGTIYLPMAGSGISHTVDNGTPAQSKLNLTGITASISGHSFRAIINSGVCSDTTVARILTVNGPVTFSADPVDTLNVCQNVTEMQFTGAAANSGAGGAPSYMWQYSNNGTTGWTNVPATEPSRTNDTLTITLANGGAAWPTIGSPTGKYYRLSANLPGCSALYNSEVAQFTISNTAAPIAIAGGDVPLCSGSAHPLTGASIGGAATSATWTTSGDGNFDNAAAIGEATYTPGLTDAGTMVTLTLTTNEVGCGTHSDTKTITYQNPGTVNAGVDINRCIDGTEANAIMVTAAVTPGIIAGTWSSSGGTFADASALSTMFTPTAPYTGTKTLTFTSGGACPVQSDALNVIFNTDFVISGYLPIAPYTSTAVCSDGEPVTFRVNHNTIPVATGARTWQSSPDGISWTDITAGPSYSFTTNISYTRLNITTNPSILDSTRYRVILSNGACSDTSETFILRINHSTIAPLADVNICATETTSSIPATVTSTGTAAVNLLWQYHNGSGWTSIPSSVTGYNTATLALDNGDALWLAAAGPGIALRLRIQRPGTSCVFLSDSIQFTRGAAVTVMAGTDIDGCSNTVVNLNGFTTGPGTFTWNDGEAGGTFSMATSPTSTYSNSTPGVYQLALVSEDPVGACPAVTDTVQVTIHAAPTVMVTPADVTVCMSGGATPVSLSGTLGGSAVSGSWTTSGSGTFVAVGNVNTTYDPTPADISAQFVQLIYTTNGNAGCVGAKDTVNLTIGNGIVLTSYTPGGATAGSRTVCNGGSTTLKVDYDATLLATRQWQVNSGSGWVDLPIDASLYGIAGWSVLSSDIFAELTLTGLTGAANGLQVRVLVTDRGCTVPFGNFTINVNGPVVFTTQPASVGVCSTAPSANFSAVVSNGGSGVLTYQWQFYNGTSWVNVPNTVAGYNGANLFVTSSASFWPGVGSSVDLRLNVSVPTCTTISSDIVTLTRTSNPCGGVNLTPNFTPSQSGVFVTTGLTKDFVITIQNTLPGNSSGQIQVFVPFISGYNMNFNPTQATAVVTSGSVAVNNSSWTVTVLPAGFLLSTSNVISGNSSLNFAIQVTSTASMTSGNLTAALSPASGGQTDFSDDSKSKFVTTF